ncbi:hypothetical protein AVO42_06825 [Thiomicrospira sp. XS5]|nr:hypothetical protein AVO42_06825 [Thiomicrospira sp. XS5]
MRQGRKATDLVVEDKTAGLRRKFRIATISSYFRPEKTNLLIGWNRSEKDVESMMKLKRREYIFRNPKKSYFKTITFVVLLMILVSSYLYSVDSSMMVDML